MKLVKKKIILGVKFCTEFWTLLKKRRHIENILKIKMREGCSGFDICVIEHNPFISRDRNDGEN